MTLQPNTSTPFVMPEFLGGPRDGEIGDILPVTELKGHIKARGGRYELSGFRAIAVPGMEYLTPDHAVYVWEVRKPKE